jgi:LuxR family transcriptional regulator, maltose regulon positive regulatory protein
MLHPMAPAFLSAFYTRKARSSTIAYFLQDMLNKPSEEREAMQHLDALQKISAPVLSPTMLHREALVKKLNDTISGQAPTGAQRAPYCKLVVLCAPAGYGKTTLLADFAQQTDLACCWYFLDRNDTDKATFLKFLVLSMRRCFPDFGKEIDLLLSDAISADALHSEHARHLELFVDALIKAISHEITERFVLFLCNFHEINTSLGVTNLINRFLHKLPSPHVLVIESRAVPELDFASLFIHNAVVGFNQTHLQFTSTEIRDLAQLQGVTSLQEREAERLATLFDGWIAGILLGNRHILQHGDTFSAASQQNMHLHRQNLFAYLVNEVFSRDPEIYDFLKSVAILQKMTPELCDGLLATTHTARRLHYLEQQGLFVTHRSDGITMVYILHPILRELLCDELRRQTPERFVALHQHAMELWRASGVPDQAIYHALEASLDTHAARLILEVYKDFLAQGCIETLSRWLDALSPGVIANSPDLLLARANTYLLQGEHALASSLLSTASDLINKQPDGIYTDEVPLFTSYINLARSKVLFQTGEYTQAYQLCLQVVEQTTANEVDILIEAYLRLGVCLINLQGDFTSSIVYLQKALQLCGRNSEKRQTAELHDTLALVYGLIGNFSLAEHHLSRASGYWKHLQDKSGKINNLLNMGTIKQHQGEFAVAESLFQQAQMQARGVAYLRRQEAYALVNLSSLYLDQGPYDRALAITEEGLALAHQVNDRFLINWTLCNLANIYVLMGDADTAMLLLSEVHLENALKRCGGRENAWYDLTYGTVLLYQRRYQEAHTCLTGLEGRLQSSGLQRLLLQSMLRLAECLLLQGWKEEALDRMNALTTQLLRDDYEQLVRRELKLLPTLQEAIRTMSELRWLQTLLQSASPVSQEELGSLSSAPEAPISVISAPQLKILALGEPTIFIDEKPIMHWRVASAMELFFFLLESGHSLSKERIIAALWPERDDTCNQKLHTTVYHLRKLLGEVCLVSDGRGYRLDLSARYGKNVWHDVALFQQHSVKAKEALAARNDELGHAEFSAMTSLYRGDYVQSFYNDWCGFQRDTLKMSYLDAHHQLARIAWRREQFDESALHWQHMLAIDACLEDAHHGLMRCYLSQGKRGLALRQYRRCVEVLRREFGVKPGIAMQELFQHLTKPPLSKR